jgi:hypothetical protein
MNRLETVPVPEPIRYRILTWVIEHGNGACVLLQIEPKHPSYLMYEKDNPFSNIEGYELEHGLYVFECEEQANRFNILGAEPVHLDIDRITQRIATLIGIDMGMSLGHDFSLLPVTVSGLIKDKRDLLRGRQEVADALGLDDASFADIVREINYRES